MYTLYSVHDRLRETTRLLQSVELVEFFSDDLFPTEELIARLEYECVNVYTKDFKAGARFLITRHFLEV